MTTSPAPPQQAPPAAEFLLDAAEVDDDRLFRPPPRENVLVTPLVDGVAALQTLEDEIAKARTFVHLACWLFDPETDIQSSAVRRRGIKTWGALLVAAARGDLLPPRERPGNVRVRILLSDFDPLLQNDLHRNAWSAHRRLLAYAGALEGVARSRFEVVVSRHGASYDSEADERAGRALRRVVRQLNAVAVWQSTDEAKRRFADMPGLWRAVTFDEGTQRFAVAPDAPLAIHLGTHHEKLCVVDGRVALCGGVDVHLGCVDTTSHNGRRPTHAVHARLEGPAVADLDRGFRARWNDEAPQYAAFIADANAARGQSILGDRAPAPVEPAPAAVAAPPNGAPAQVHRTRAASVVPGTTAAGERRDVEEGYAKAIGRAERFVYLEQRYLRAGSLADALVERRDEVPGLVALVVLPVVPDELATTDGAADAVRHGLSLQHDALARLRTAFGEGLGVYSPLQRRAVLGTRPTVYLGSPQIPVHGTLLIVDDVYASIGSAHATDRSFRLDGEVAVAWVDPASVRALREQLWKELLGAPARLTRWEPAEFVHEWNTIAEANAHAAPGGRRGFVVPHDPEQRPGARVDGLRNELAELVDTEPNAVADYLPDLRPDDGAAGATGQPALTDLERDLVTRGLPLALDYAEVATALFVQREGRDPVAGDAADTQTLSELRALIQPEIAQYEERAGKEFRELSTFVRASFGEKTESKQSGVTKAEATASKAQAVANYLMVRPLYVRWGYANPAASVFSKIKRPSEGAKLLGHDIVGGAHEKFVEKLDALRTVLDAWDETDGVSHAINGVGGFVPVVPEPDGTFRPRFVAGQSRPKLSNHALGLAIDIDANWNPQVPAGSATIRLLKQITTQAAAENPALGLPSEGFDFGKKLIDPALNEWPTPEQAAGTHRLAQQASDALRGWLQSRIARELELTAAADAALAAVNLAQDEKKAADASGDAARKAAAKDTLAAAKVARKAAKDALDGDPDLTVLRALRTAQGGGQKGKAVVAGWADFGILSLPVVLVAAFKSLDRIRWGMEYNESKDAMHFEVEPPTDFIPRDAPVLSGPRDLLTRPR
ncbi:MAG TPA: hypothetical protein VGJ77_20160 [Gaiellaceae bacterium]